MNQLALLQSLLFMNFGGAHFFDHVTQHCFASNSKSLIGKCNRVCNSIGITADEITEIKNYFGATPFTWVIDSSEKATAELLQANSMNLKGSFPIMFADLSCVKHEPYSDGIDVKEITSELDFVTWIAIIAPTYHINDVELAKALRFFIARAPRGTLKLYLGFYKTIPVGASMLIYHDSLVSLHMVGTLENHRHKGIGYAVSHKPLLDARNTGYTQACLMASSAGLPLYPKLGFQQDVILDIYGNY